MRKVDGEVINETAHVEDMLSSYNYYNYNNVVPVVAPPQL